jgi:hypothetical protein
MLRVPGFYRYRRSPGEKASCASSGSAWLTTWAEVGVSRCAVVSVVANTKSPSLSRYNKLSRGARLGRVVEPLQTRS